MSEKITVENVNTPGRTTRVDKAKYEAMRAAVLRALPDTAPGLSLAQLKAGLNLPQDLFPGNAKSGWWMMCVQLDLRAKGVLATAKGSPVRLFRT